MRRWLFGDQLGPQFVEDQDVLMVESKAVFRRRRFHRAKAHLVLSAMRHRAAELGDRCDYRQVESYAEALQGELDVIQPTSRAADRFVRERGYEVQENDRAFATTRADFAAWAGQRKSLLLEDFYRWQRRRFDVLMEGSEPVGGRWNFDTDNREPAPTSDSLGITQPWWPAEDEIDHGVREDLDRWEREGIEFLGDDGPRWAPATRAEALAALEHFVEHRLRAFGPHEDAMLAADPWMAHSALSPALNLGLLHPLECVEAAQRAYQQGKAPLQSVEGYVRQVLGWREYVWSVYWHAPADYGRRNAMRAHGSVPGWWWELDQTQELQANCLKHVMADLRQRGWVHHIPRLMVLSSYAQQRGWSPQEVTAWFHQAFVDGYEWVMVPNVVGMSQHADGGLMATKPYTSGGAYLDRMSDYCGGCRYDPKKRLGDDACPFTAGYWSYLSRNADRLEGNRRMMQPLAGLRRLKDLDEVVAQEKARGNDPP
jgi:deoxyribodipyrimidine photolyase-related protein